jgi:hypothetical protein
MEEEVLQINRERMHFSVSELVTVIHMKKEIHISCFKCITKQNEKPFRI